MATIENPKGGNVTEHPIVAIQNDFESEGLQAQLKESLPKMVKLEHLVSVSLTVIRNNQFLLKCSRQSLMACLIGCGQLGLSPDPILKQAYFVPYWSNKLQSWEAQLIPSFSGYITLARRSGELQNVEAQAVYKNDKFEIRFGLNQVLDHVPNFKERGELIGAWTLFSYRDGNRPSIDFMTMSEVEAIMERTKSRDKKNNIVGPWVSDPAEMAKKSVIRRHIKLAPLSVEDRVAQLAHAENLALSDDESQASFFMPNYDQPIEIPAAGAGQEKKQDPPETKKDPGKQKEAPADKKNAQAEINNFMGKCIRLDGPNFKKFILNNYAEISQFPEWVESKLRIKWERLLKDEPWPSKEDTESTAAGSEGAAGDGYTYGVEIIKHPQFERFQELQREEPEIFKKTIVGRQILNVKQFEEALADLEDEIDFMRANGESA